ncbi:MAG: DUF4876 domain-containing protein [Bacteroidales bacterium]|nr:DUF4876 domain-containing protein [Bacteroidales bacterium]
MINKFYFLALLSMALLAWSCDDKLSDVETSLSLPAHLNITLPVETSGASCKIVEETFEVKNVTTGRVTTFTSRNDIYLAPGLYDVSYNAVVEVADENGNVTTRNVQGFAQGVEINAQSSTIDLNTYLYVPTDDFIISEVFFTGTLRPTGNQYYGDDYIKIYNNTDHVLYADGLSFLESKFTTTQKYNYRPNVMASAFTVHAIYTIPGSGHDYPVQPGEELIICDTGIDHRVANENSFDLSGAHFEWYDISTSPTNLDIDSPTVPNLDKWYCYTLSFFLLHNRGFKAWALARIPLPKDEYLAQYMYRYNYEVVVEAGSYPMSQQAYKIPNEWIVDAVNCSVEAEYAWNVVHSSLDRGYAHCGSMDHDKTRYFHSVRRKMLYLKDGRPVLKDTNNSSEDFNSHVTASEIENQGTAIDYLGNKCTQLTWDGVTTRND